MTTASSPIGYAGVGGVSKTQSLSPYNRSPTSVPRRTEVRPQIDEISIRHLKYAIAIADAGSVSAAASRLHVAQPSLSQQMRKLEGRLDAALFTRVSDGVRPTAEGELFLEHARHLIDVLEGAADELNDIGRSWKIGVRPGINVELVETTERMLLGSSGKHRASFTSASSVEILRSLENGGMDFGLVRLPFDHPNLTYTPSPLTNLASSWRKDIL